MSKKVTAVFLAVVLTIALFAIAFVACGDGGGGRGGLSCGCKCTWCKEQGYCSSYGSVRGYSCGPASSCGCSCH